MIMQMATDVNNAILVAVKPYQQKVKELESRLSSIRVVATKWPRCCDQWQDSLGGMHCKECSQKTFAMFYLIQKILGINKECEPIQNPK